MIFISIASQKYLICTWISAFKELVFRTATRLGCFLFNKNSGLKFRIFHVPNGTVHSACTDPTKATARLVIVLESRIQKSGIGDNNFVKWKGTFRSDRTKCPDRSKWITFKADPENSGRTKPKWSVPFDVPSEMFRIVG